MEINKIHHMNCIDGMNQMKSESVDMVVTSPPYDQLRTYNNEDIEAVWNFDVFKDVAKELYRVMKPGGTIVWVVGDAVIDGSESGTSFRQALHFKDIGFNLHDTMIYEKNGPTYPAHPKSTRYSQVFEYMFVLTKGSPKTVNILMDRKNKWAGTSTFGISSNRQKDGELKTKKRSSVSEYGARYNIWKINGGMGHSTKDKIAYEHPAIFPETLAEDHIKTWTNPGDLVLDPFSGSGTTAKMCLKTNRNFIGFEMNEEFYKLSQQRISKYNTEDLEDW
jgi:site-specific DNA-methyltransferase (adenine-specific)